MSDDLPPLRLPQKVLISPPPPPPELEEKEIADVPEESFEEINNSIDQLLSGISSPPTNSSNSGTSTVTSRPRSSGTSTVTSRPRSSGTSTVTSRPRSSGAPIPPTESGALSTPSTPVNVENQVNLNETSSDMVDIETTESDEKSLSDNLAVFDMSENTKSTESSNLEKELQDEPESISPIISVLPLKLIQYLEINYMQYLRKKKIL